jgi:hypothetical protein
MEEGGHEEEEVKDATAISPKGSSPSRKRVRISEQEPDSLGGCPVGLSTEERDRTWWSKAELGDFKSTSKKQCESYRHERRYSDCLTDAYETACALAEKEPEHVVAGADGDVRQRAPSPHEGLQRWHQDAGPRGLETYSSRMHALRRKRHVRDHRQAVFLEQARQDLVSARDSERIARQAAQASKKAVAFASLVGRADAWAAHGPEADELRHDGEGDESSEHSDESDSSENLKSDE